MKFNQSNKFTPAKSTRSRRSSLWILIVAMIALGLTTMSGATGQAPVHQQAAKGMDVPAGFDGFRTVAGATKFEFGDAFTIPADFFDKGSRPFAGTISFKGEPLGSYRDKKLGRADTIVERQKSADFSSEYGPAEIPIEVTALSLVSTRPISVQVGKGWQRWDVKLGLSPSRKSEGTMKLVRRGKRGGTFDSQFIVYPALTFTRVSDGGQKMLDVGAMQWDEKSLATITLSVRGAPWSERVDAKGTRAFSAGVNTAGARITIAHTSPRHSHLVIFEPIPNFMEQ